MTAFNVVRLRVKPEGEQTFLDMHKSAKLDFPGMRRFSLFKTGDRAYCVIGEWDSFNHIAAARPQMIGLLDGFRHTLEDLGMGLGVTDPVSGPVVVDKAKPKKIASRVKSTSRAKAKAKKRPAKKAVRKAAKKPVTKKKAKRK
jgi:hypothetical protein